MHQNLTYGYPDVIFLRDAYATCKKIVKELFFLINHRITMDFIICTASLHYINISA